MRSKESCSPCRKLFNDMWHITCTRINWGNSLLLVVENQIGTLTLSPYFGHNLCFKYRNGSCGPSDFQWYKELFNPMIFDPYNRLLKIRDFIRTPTPKVGAHSRVWGFIPPHFPTLLGAWNVTPGLHF
jgi:hypothetical protein